MTENLQDPFEGWEEVEDDDLEKLERTLNVQEFVPGQKKPREQLLKKKHLVKQELPKIPEVNRATLRRYETVVKDLPSKGVTYPENARIFVYEYLYPEIAQISAEIDYLTLDMLFSTILEGIVTRNMDKNDITFDDFLFICMQRKMITFPDDSITYFPVCPKCGKEKIVTYLFESFEFHDLEITRENLPIKEDFKFYFIDPVTDEQTEIIEELEFKPLTIGNFIKLFEDKFDENATAYKVYQCVNKDPFQLMDQYFKYVSNENGLKLDIIDKKLSHGLKPKIENCEKEETDSEGKVTKCDGVISFEVDTSYSLVLPFRFSYAS